VPTILIRASQFALWRHGLFDPSREREAPAGLAVRFAVNDDQAFEVTRAFHDRAVGKREAFAEALRAVREAWAPRSHTYRPYLFHGDVMARFQ
jgi:hypothetical protein